MVAADPPTPRPISPPSLDELLDELERLLDRPAFGGDPRRRYTLMRVDERDYECRTFAGDVGRGETRVAAVSGLVDSLL